MYHLWYCRAKKKLYLAKKMKRSEARTVSWILSSLTLVYMLSQTIAQNDHRIDNKSTIITQSGQADIGRWKIGTCYNRYLRFIRLLRGNLILQQ